MRRIVTLLVMVIVASMHPVFGQDAPTQQILFQAWNDGDADIYTIDADGQNLQNLIDNHGWDVNPSWSPDGQHILFVSDRDDSENDTYLDYAVYMMNADGQNAQMVINNVNYETEPTWSPDGTWIAVVRDENTAGNELACTVSIMKPDGSELQLLFTTPHCDTYAARWSPDSTSVLVNANKAIYSVRLTDADVVQLTSEDSESFSPNWSRDGSKIAYVVNQVTDSGTNYDIYLMNADGSDQTALITKSLPEVGPRFTADDSSILYSSGDDLGNRFYALDLATNKVKMLVDQSLQLFWWTLSPDGSQFVYTQSSNVGIDRIFVFDLETLTNRSLIDMDFKSAGSYGWRPGS